jgi:prophage regulatory protein
MPRIVSYTELKPRFGIRWTRKHIIELIRAGRFPHPVHLGGQTIGWPENEIDDWLKARIAERDVRSETASASLET